jgi:hypothetical protein
LRGYPHRIAYQGEGIRQEGVVMVKEIIFEVGERYGNQKKIHQTHHLVDSEEEKSEMFSFLFHFKMLSLEAD